uniref:Uncharacterized protein n=1 Tax=Kalanchoe fedtschenkoi TaxID=63787 RepID=A0A7N0VCR2_KALFE
MHGQALLRDHCPMPTLSYHGLHLRTKRRTIKNKNEMKDLSRQHKNEIKKMIIFSATSICGKLWRSISLPTL